MIVKRLVQLRSTGLILRFAGILIGFLLAVGCGDGSGERTTAGETGVLTAVVLYQIEVAGGARDFTFDADGNLYLFDYVHYTIRKFDPGGRRLLEFGGSVEEGGLFTHLMDIEIFDDRLVALDSVARFTFDLEGELLDREDFTAEVICGRPVVSGNGEFIGEWLRDPDAKNILTLRRADGTERARLESYDLSDFIPVPVPVDQIEQMRSRSESLPPPLFMYVPNAYRLIHKLFVGTDGDIWVYLQSLERTGFLRFSSRGRAEAFYTLEVDFDPGEEDVVIREYEGKLWFLVPGRDDVVIYTAMIPD